MPPSVDFGFRDVPREDKPRLVRDVFDRVADRYDVMNDLMSLGVHRWWKAELVADAAPRAGESIVDLAGGTGDVAARLAQRGAHVVVCDMNQAMVERGRDRAIDRGRLDGIEWLVGDGENLPFADRSADALTMAFGLRNVRDIDRALGEVRRVLKPGGRFHCLEFSRVMPALRGLYDLYSFNVLPALGRMVAGDRDAYTYLAESIRRFPDQEALTRRIAAQGLDRVRHRNLSGGIVAIHSAWRL
jgi:demethylmenaquinone methyltransferase/2-methoxy-6-polyprenyl-1,4-benzoquinol methylase